MKPVRFVSPSKNKTIAYAKKFSAKLKPGDIIALTGNLGGGKTTFIKGLALGLGLDDPDEVKSPTFALMHVYRTKPPIYHFDLYRLESPKEIENIGLDEFLQDASAICCVEWADRAAEFFPPSTYRVHFEVVGTNERRIVIRGHS